MCNRSRVSVLLAVSVFALCVAAPQSAPQSAQTVSAKGSVTVTGQSCNFAEPNPAEQCHVGGSGAKVSFSFSGEVVNPLSPSVAVTGNFSASYPDTGYKTEFVAGTAVIFPNHHLLTFNGTCETRDAAGQLLPFASGACSGFARDNTANGAVDSVNITAFTFSGFAQACCEPASGNVNIQ